MTTIDPYPTELMPLSPASIDGAPDVLVRAINRLAEAVEQLVLVQLTPMGIPTPPPAANVVSFAALPPVQVVAAKPPCPFHGIDKVQPSSKFVGFYCTAKDANKPRGYCDWSMRTG